MYAVVLHTLWFLSMRQGEDDQGAHLKVRTLRTNCTNAWAHRRLNLAIKHGLAEGSHCTIRKLRPKGLGWQLTHGQDTD